jgi:tetratricopeptide (TPR) repeat protein
LRRVRDGLGLAALAFGLAMSSIVAAHDDVDHQIATVTVRIAAEPRDAELYLKRGELYRARGRWQAALEDYDRAARLDPALDVVDLVRGKLFLEKGDAPASRRALDRFIGAHPEHSEGRLARGRALVKVGERALAVEDFTRAIELSSAPPPEAYLERSDALAAEGRQRIDEAVGGLDQGIAKLGPLAVLELRAIDLELERKRYDAALDRLERIARQSHRQETWLARRSEILEIAGRKDEAQATAKAALAAIDALPASHRATRAMDGLRARIGMVLERLDARAPRAAAPGVARATSRGGG